MIVEGEHPANLDVHAEIEKAILCITKAGKAPGNLSVGEKLARQYIELGVTLVAAVCKDTTLLVKGLQALASKFKDIPGATVDGGNY